jgi:hypothetical protein
MKVKVGLLQKTVNLCGRTWRDSSSAWSLRILVRTGLVRLWRSGRVVWSLVSRLAYEPRDCAELRKGESQMGRSGRF